MCPINYLTSMYNFSRIYSSPEICTNWEWWVWVLSFIRDTLLITRMQILHSGCWSNQSRDRQTAEVCTTSGPGLLLGDMNSKSPWQDGGQQRITGIILWHWYCHGGKRQWKSHHTSKGKRFIDWNKDVCRYFNLLTLKVTRSLSVKIGGSAKEHVGRNGAKKSLPAPKKLEADSWIQGGKPKPLVQRDGPPGNLKWIFIQHSLQFKSQHLSIAYC